MVRKAVIPAAGLGINFLPATKAQSKEMLPIIVTPTIQYVVEEAIDSGIDDILIIIGKGKRAIEDHFDRNHDLELYLENKKRVDQYNEIRRIADMANIHFIRQKETNGLGDARHLRVWFLCRRGRTGHPYRDILDFAQHHDVAGDALAAQRAGSKTCARPRSLGRSSGVRGTKAMDGINTGVASARSVRFGKQFPPMGIQLSRT